MEDVTPQLRDKTNIRTSTPQQSPRVVHYKESENLSLSEAQRRQRFTKNQYIVLAIFQHSAFQTTKHFSASTSDSTPNHLCQLLTVLRQR